MMSLIIIITAPVAFNASTPQRLTPPFVMLSGIMFPVNMLPKTLEYIGRIFPATWGYMNMCNNSFEASSLVPLVLIFAIAAAISIYGKLNM